MTNDVTAPMFAAVLLGQPRYYYTAEARNPVENIHRIVRDGANRLWLSTQYGGVPVEEASVTVLGPVPEYSNLADERASQAEAEGHRLKARVLELEAENRKCCVHCAPLRARVAELEALNEHLDEESGQRDCAALEAEVERLKAEAGLLTAKLKVVNGRAQWLEANMGVIARERDQVSEESYRRSGMYEDEATRLRAEIVQLEAEVDRLQNGLAQVMRATNPGIDYDPAYAILDVQSALSRLEWLHDYIRGRRGVTNPEQAAQDERAAVVAWIENRSEHMSPMDRIYTGDAFRLIVQGTKFGEHWPEGTP